MLITNTLSGAKEPLPATGGKPLRLFVCGPTVYDEPHIGNARMYIVFDTFVRFLRSQKIKVFYLQNITDVDDKIIARAREEKTSASAIARKYTAIFKRNMRALRVNSVDSYAPATKYIPEIIVQVTRLIEKGNAYKIEGDGWYFDLSTFPDYGKLAKRTVEQAEDGVSRIDENPRKRNRGDFCLWKLAKTDAKDTKPNANDAKKKHQSILVDGEPAWWAPFGWGRPGWHIEDTAISEKFFGPQYDIHGGGRDLIFPHHEAEIAQQESASGLKPFVKIWMHVGLVTMSGKKMSKSLRNFITIDDFLKAHGANVLRFISLSTHYRSPNDISDEGVEAAKHSLASLEEFFAKLALVAQRKDHPEQTVNIEPLTKNFERSFVDAMEDDLNTPRALGVIFEFINETNPMLWNLRASQMKHIKKTFLDMLDTFGISLALLKIPQNVRRLVKKREISRSHQQFTHADTLRKEITALGYKVDDTPVGPLILKDQILKTKNLKSKP